MFISWTNRASALRARSFRRQLIAAIGGLVAFAVTSGICHAAKIEKIENGRQGTATLLFSGPIVAGDTQRLRTAMAALPMGTVVSVMLDSPGGNLMEGLTLGSLFYEARVATVVQGDGAICYSACALAFLGGRSARSGEPMRVKMSGGKLGFHQFARRNFDPLKIYTKADYDREVALAQEITRDIVRYLKSIGEDCQRRSDFVSAGRRDFASRLNA